MVLTIGWLRLIAMESSGLGDAEAYYWAWSRNIDWSYYDHPPMVAWLIRIFNSIDDTGVFWTRFPSATLYIFSCIVLHRTTVLIFESDKAAFYALMMFNFCPILAYGGLQIVPDVPAMFFWFLFVYLVAYLLKNDKPMLWYLVGITVGLGLLSKYMVLPLIPFTLLMLAWHKGYRKHLKAPHIYLGGVLGLIVFSPVLIWNVKNDFPSFKFHLTERHHSGRGFELNHMAEALGGQMLYYSPFIWLALIYVAYVLFKKVFVEKEEKFFVPFWLGVPPLAFFMLITFWTKESEPHWTALGYLALFPAWGYLFVEGGKFFKRFTALSLGVGFILSLVLFFQTFYPVIPFDKPRYDITNTLYGWDEAGPKIEEMYASLPDDKPKFVMSHNHVLSGPIVFAVQDRIPVFSLNKKTDQFDFFDPAEPPIGANFIFVADNIFTEGPSAYYLFDRVEEPVEIEIRRRRNTVYARTFYLYKGYGYRGLK